MEQVQDHCGELEREVAEVRGQLNEKDTEICQLELVSGRGCVDHCDKIHLLIN